MLRNLRKVPLFIADKLQTWIDSVEREGLMNVRKIPGYHDEPLKGDRKGQRFYQAKSVLSSYLYDPKWKSGIRFGQVGVGTDD